MELKIEKLKNPETIKKISVIVISLIISFVFLKSFKALWLKNKGLKQELNKKTEELNRGLSVAANKESINSQIQELTSKLSAIEERFFSNTEEILKYLNQFAEESKISLDSIEPLEKTQLELSSRKDLWELPVNIKLKSDYHQVVMFLDKIERARKLMVVEEIKIDSNPRDVWNHGIQIRLTAPILVSLRNLRDR